MQILGCFIHLFWKNGWFKNPANLNAENILAYISRTRFSLNIAFIQEHNEYKFSLLNKFSENFDPLP